MLGVRAIQISDSLWARIRKGTLANTQPLALSPLLAAMTCIFYARAQLAVSAAQSQDVSPPLAFRICSVRSHARAQLAGSLAYLLLGSRLAVLFAFRAFGP